MRIDELTIGEARQLSGMFGGQARDDAHWKIGQADFIRTVTYHLTGRIVKVTPHELVLTEAAWIADDGRFAEFLRTGEAQEVEPFPDGEVIVGRGSLIDARARGTTIYRGL